MFQDHLRGPPAPPRVILWRWANVTIPNNNNNNQGERGMRETSEAPHRSNSQNTTRAGKRHPARKKHKNSKSSRSACTDSEQPDNAPPYLGCPWSAVDNLLPRRWSHRSSQLQVLPYGRFWRGGEWERRFPCRFSRGKGHRGIGVVNDHSPKSVHDENPAGGGGFGHSFPGEKEAENKWGGRKGGRGAKMFQRRFSNESWVGRRGCNGAFGLRNGDTGGGA